MGETAGERVCQMCGSNWVARASTWASEADPVTSREADPFRTTMVLLVIEPAASVDEKA
ncbi:MAG TPA: hypothetical protein VGY51_01490 [Acidimicrobiales bacterium]|nr:hypothetical protein [Acidimicrobiales bacterium]